MALRTFQAIAMVPHLNTLQKQSETRCELVIFKTRVSPMKSQTIPRVELLASLIIARLMSNVYEVLTNILQTEERCCCTDSRVALRWIQSTSKEYKLILQIPHGQETIII